MPETGLPHPPRSHTATVEWQGFEIRMRRRRVERCVLRAEIALEAGYPEDARLALAEARQLDPHEPSLDELAARLDAAAPRQPAQPPAGASRALPAVAAGLVLAVLSGLLLTLAPGPAVREAPAAQPAQETAPARAPFVGIQEQFVTPEIVVSEPASPSAAARPELAAPREPAPQARRAEPTPPPVEAAPPARAEAAPPARAEAAPPPPAPAPAQPRTTDPPARAAATPEPVAPTLVGTADATPAARDAAEPSADVDPAVENASRIRAVLSRYEAAYTGLDAAAARAVWPAVDERALARAFNNLASQRISLDQCDVSVTGASARAQCQGSASWVPKVGGGGRTEARQWTFDLRQAGGGWQIVRAEAR
jgi:hypothetical protein